MIALLKQVPVCHLSIKLEVPHASESAPVVSPADSVSPSQARSLFSLSTAMLAGAAKAYGFSHIIPSVLSAYDKLRDEVNIAVLLRSFQEENTA